jgi:hypothetical protein
MSENIKENVSRRSIWLRLVFMIVLCVAYGVAELITFAVVVFQFLASLFAGQPNDRLARFGRNLARYFQQIIVFMTFATEEKPFPFAPWPDEPHEEAPVEEDGNQLNGISENAGDVPESDATVAAENADDTEDADKSKN